MQQEKMTGETMRTNLISIACGALTRSQRPCVAATMPALALAAVLVASSAATDRPPMVGWGDPGRSWYADWGANEGAISIGGRAPVRIGPAPTMDECHERGGCVSLNLACDGGLRASLLIDQHPEEAAPLTVAADLPSLALRLLTGPRLGDTVSRVEISVGPHRWRTEARRRQWDWSFARSPHAVHFAQDQARALVRHALERNGPVTLALTPVFGTDHRLAGTATFALETPASQAALSEMSRICPDASSAAPAFRGQSLGPLDPMADDGPVTAPFGS